MNDVNQPSQEQLNAAQTIMNNAGYNAANVVQMRLNMDPEIANFQKFLLGFDTYVDFDEKTGEPKEVLQRVGDPLVNNKGLQAIMHWATSSFLNRHTVQGNFLDEDWYGVYMCDLYKDSFQDLLVNRINYGIEYTQLQPIHDRMIACARLILTRPIADKERLGMNNTTRIEERSQTNQMTKGGGFSPMNLFGRK